MDVTQLRIALVSGNYNMVRDGPTQALNRLVGYLLRQGAAVRIFAPTIPNPQVEATGELIKVPSFALPGRPEYRFPWGLYGEAWRKFAEFNANMIHVASPDFAARQAAKWGRDHNLPVLASVHTRFETYPRYYGFKFAEPMVENWLRKFYRRADGLVAPTETARDVLIEQRMHDDIGIWSRGVDRTIFDPSLRDPAWRREQGLADDDVVVAFLGRVVMEKGLDAFADAIAELNRRGVKHRVMVIGDGPARGWFANHLPEDAIYLGYQAGRSLGRFLASADMLLNPSVTEAFGNVTLEAMASGIPVVAARATGADFLVNDGVTGVLCTPGQTNEYADALQAYIEQPELRARHGAAGERRSLDFDWDRINQAMVDTYLRLGQKRLGR